MTEAVIASYARTPIGKAYRGSLNATHGATLGAHAVAAAVTRAGLDPSEVQDVIVGASLGEGTTGANIARQVALRAGLPVSTPGVTINRFCSSGLQTIALAAQRVMTGEVDIARRRRPGVDQPGPERAHEHLHGRGSVAARAQARDLHDDARHGRGRGRTLRHRPRAAGCVRAAQPAADRRRTGGGALRRRDRADLDPASRRRSRHRRGASRAGDAERRRMQPAGDDGRGRSPRFHR